MATTGKGSKIKTVITVDENSLGGKSLSEVDYKIDFYAGKKEGPVTDMYTVRKGDEGTKVVDNTIVSACDTTNLDLGNLYATLTMTYSDSDLNLDLKEVMTVTFPDTKIVDAPLSSDEVDDQEVIVPEVPHPDAPDEQY